MRMKDLLYQKVKIYKIHQQQQNQNKTKNNNNNSAPENIPFHLIYYTAPISLVLCM